MFGRKKETCRREEDKIWRTTDVKLKGLLSDARRLDAEGYLVVIVSFFSETMRSVQDALLEAKVPAEKLSTTMSLVRKLDGRGVYVMEADRLQPADAGQGPPPARLICFLVAEHHPMPGEEKRILECMNQLRVPASVTYYDALDSPLFLRFGGERMVPLLDKLGMQPDEVITHGLVTRAIENTQKKIQKLATGQTNARSVGEWFQINYPPTA